LKLYESESVLDALERINAAIAGSASIDELLPRVLDEMLEIFDCDRAWLLYPCIPEVETYVIPMERTRPEWPGAGLSGVQIPMDPFSSEVFRRTLADNGPTAFDRTTHGDPAIFERFQIKSQLLLPIYPRSDHPWLLGIHNCAELRVYDAAMPLFSAVGRRIGDGLSTLLATRELRRSQERFRTLVEHAPEAIVIIDATSLLFTEANPKASLLYGATRDALLDGVGFLHFSPESQPSGESSAGVLAQNLSRALAGDNPTFEWTHTALDGSSVPCEVRLVALPEPGQRMVRASITDISARKRANEERAQLERQLAQSQKMEAIGQLTGGVAHDFNNLLTVILGNLDFVRVEKLDQAEQEALEHATSAALKAAGLIRQLLAFSRQQPLQPAALDVGALLASAELLLSRTLGEDINLEITVNCEADCEADPSQLQSALLNLAINARDAMPKGGLLKIIADEVDLDGATTAPGAFVRFQIVDEGCGIEPDILDAIFAPFFTTKAVGQGSGLGLAMVYGFAKQSGGQLLVRSVVGSGSTFELYLPRALGGEKPAEPTATPVPSGSGQTILLVEDDEGVRHVVRTHLMSLGYRVVEADTGPAALQKLLATPQADLLLSDVILPGGLTGPELGERAQRLRPDVPVVYMSGYTEKALLTRGRLPKGIRLLEKPFTGEELAYHVAVGLGTR
jgi:PAS domain S-box-containing protein